MYIVRGHRLKLQTKIELLSLKMVLVLTDSVDPDEMLHFIWVFTVCQNTHLGVSSIQRVNCTNRFSLYLIIFTTFSYKNELGMNRNVEHKPGFFLKQKKNSMLKKQYNQSKERMKRVTERVHQKIKNSVNSVVMFEYVIVNEYKIKIKGRKKKRSVV